MGGLENPRGRIVVYRCTGYRGVCIEDRWLVGTQLNESKADYSAGLEPHKSSISNRQNFYRRLSHNGSHSTHTCVPERKEGPNKMGPRRINVKWSVGQRIFQPQYENHETVKRNGMASMVMQLRHPTNGGTFGRRRGEATGSPNLKDCWQASRAPKVVLHGQHPISFGTSMPSLTHLLSLHITFLSTP